MTDLPEKPAFEQARCKLCGRPVVWAHNRTGGGRIPLDPVAPVFHATRHRTGVDAEQVRTKRLRTGPTTGCLVSHFATCVAKTRAWALLHEHLRSCSHSPELEERTRDYLERGEP